MRVYENLNLKLKLQKTEDIALEIFMNELKNMQVLMPLISTLGNKDLRQRHWDKIFKVIGKDYSDIFTFQDLLNHQIMQKKEAIDDISQQATGEYLIEFQLESIKKKWTELQFNITNYQD